MRVLTDYAAAQFVARSLPIARCALCRTSADVARAAKQLRLPVVMKLTGVLHKTDIGGVFIAHDQAALEKGYAQLLKLARRKKLKPVLMLQEFVQGTEVIIGIKRDAAFGHAIMVGIGGTAVELLKDVSFRICPITVQDAGEMLGELKMQRLLTGFRGSPPANMKQLTALMVKASRLPLRHRTIEEMDINPLIAGPQGAKAADVRIVFS